MKKAIFLVVFLVGCSQPPSPGNDLEKIEKQTEKTLLAEDVLEQTRRDLNELEGRLDNRKNLMQTLIDREVLAKKEIAKFYKEIEIINSKIDSLKSLIKWRSMTW